ncbi:MULTISPECIES: iron-sulfur cluster insertion protein ErpA [Gammaproteobacteria]|uniref:iron-sulfur cluster insertion protein ErpA n=1 Tax=Gammaproteobacteria TaxID=1236 RepID=UPI000C76EE91|nr:MULTISPECIES: iron-sulfur cluster insertion protein ErpA [Gammaproteobacteria]MBO9480622.1 iron-sulfur cluster insertion protein ErpA [Salinisphaera sp. G21_0]MBO9496585.1 iron-sulfur cluster insertion protein ErpA [Thalassotalea sp. G20_0]WBA80466.1 iron-sulfur cluster insertion protein ErpA [Endozoicomonas sp. GU-1]WBA88031.1 iron-sulfur cluster insertion protein ErpA [Endozoicomonas sp. GU-1]
MSVVETVIPEPISVTEAAARRVSELLADETEENQRLRVYVTGGGCSGFQYGFTFDSNLADDDTLITRDGAAIVVDFLSYQYLVGAEIDYEEGLEGSRFLVKNPNAKSTCGCGSSFSI